MPQTPEARAILSISVLRAVLKSFSLFYFLLLPILFAAGTINARQLGYIGALLLVGVLSGALTVTYRLHTFPKLVLLRITLGLLFVATVFLFWTDIKTLAIAYLLIGWATGVGTSTLDALVAEFTAQGKRYKAFAQGAMLSDIARIIYPVIAGIIYASIGFTGLVAFALTIVFIFSTCTYLFTSKYSIDNKHASISEKDSATTQRIRHNKPFFFVMILEFLDSFSSAQLFVFLPTLLIFRGFTIEHSLVMQSFVFTGYLSGRWLVSFIAQRFNGFIAVGIAEIGMVTSIVLILFTPPAFLIYPFCFLLGIFSRGTSPVIKALACDQLTPQQMRRGSAIHVMSGGIGDAVGQLAFGLLLAWLGVTAPFIAAAIFAGLAAGACFIYKPYQK